MLFVIWMFDMSVRKDDFVIFIDYCNILMKLIFILSKNYNLRKIK